MIQSRFFKNPKMGFETVGPPITEEQINRAIPEEFSGKDQFVEFYLCHNGGLIEQEHTFTIGIFFTRSAPMTSTNSTFMTFTAFRRILTKT